MKKIFQSTAFRAICALVIGVLLIKFPDNTVTGITIAIGVLFLLSGVLSCLSYIQARRHASETPRDGSWPVSNRCSPSSASVVSSSD